MKRNLLFEADEYRRILSQEVHAEHVVLVNELGLIVDQARASHRRSAI